MHRPSSTEYAPAHEKYVALVGEYDIVPALERQREEMFAFLRAIPEAQGNVRHPPYTWSIKEVVGHLTDSERVFGYRALRFARADSTPLPGFDENAYSLAAQFDRVSLAGLVSEFEALRLSHLWLFRNLPDAAWPRTGDANGTTVSVRALAYILVGHARHHLNILRRRLGVV
jgi:hypothetical protein